MLLICLTSVNESKAQSDSETIDASLAAIAAGDRDALASLYHKISSSVYAFALSILKNTHDAEEVLHDCFVKIFSEAGTYHSQGKPLAWILTIARNLCMHKLREHKKRSDIPEEDWERYLHEQDGLDAEDRIVIRECINRLTEEERQIVLLHAVSGMKHREIADVMRLPLATVLSKYRRALNKLKVFLEQEESDR